MTKPTSNQISRRADGQDYAFTRCEFGTDISSSWGGGGQALHAVKVKLIFEKETIARQNLTRRPEVRCGGYFPGPRTGQC